MAYQNKPPRGSSKMEYRKFRVRGHVKSFRDLEIYKVTTTLSSRIFQVELPPNLKNKKKLEEELAILHAISKQIPRLIAESYGNKFVDKPLAYSKLEKAMQTVSNVVTKLDFLIGVTEHEATQQAFAKLIREYQMQQRKILNLKRAWVRMEEKYGKVNAGIASRLTGTSAGVVKSQPRQKVP